MFAHARAASPAECCGLVGGREGAALSVYPMRNVAPRPFSRYEAAIEDLVDAPKRMRERSEELLGIYHSHPLASEPVPSETDVRLAFYPEAVYFIIGFDEAGQCVLRAFRIYERDARWERASFHVVED